MDQKATAPGIPAANRKAVPRCWRIGVFALTLQAAMTTVHADESLPGLSDLPGFLRIALLETSSTATVSPDFYFRMPDTAPEIRSVTSSQVRLGIDHLPPLAKPEVLEEVAAATAPTATPSRQDADAPKPTLLFGSRGKPVSLTPVTKRWTRALGELEAGREQRLGFRAYSAILDKVRDQRRGLQIPKVNYMVNRLVTYRDDVRLWQAGEYWASPVETLEKRAGDCEDYAILKYALLRDLGVDDSDMRIVVLRDTAARSHHAVLSVRHDGNWLILDNRFSRVRFERDLPNYQALYTVNASGEWSHTPEKGNPVRLAARLKSTGN